MPCCCARRQSSGPFLAREAARDMPKFFVLWGALAVSVATFAIPASIYAAPDENIEIEMLLKGGWQIAGYTSTLDDRSAFILPRHPDETYLVQAAHDPHAKGSLELLQAAIVPPPTA
jgi:hypothetical protein